MSAAGDDGAEPGPAFKRVLLKLSGEALMGPREYGTDAETVAGTAREALQRGLKVMDSTALSLCMDNHLPIYVFNMNDAENIERIVSGDRVGTLVTT